LTHYYRFNPKLIEQSNPYRCWAAALESWLDCIFRAKGKVTTGTWSGTAAATYNVLDDTEWRRDTKSQEEIIDQYSPYLDGNGEGLSR
jgi:hypothetical protein